MTAIHCIITTALNSVSHAVKLHSYSMSIFTQFITKILSVTAETNRKFSLISTYPLTMFGPHPPPSLESSKASGIDNLNPKVLKYSLSNPIYHLFCESISHGQLPTQWKMHRIIPIFKCGYRSQVNNYRPISLLCIISKVLERIVYNHIIEFLFSSFSIYQFAFVPSSNTHPYYIYSRADWDGMLEFLTHYNFNPMYNLTNINLKWQFIKDVLLDAASQFVPISKPKSHCRPKWFNSEVQHKLNCIHTIRGKIKARPTPHNTAKLKAAEESLWKMQNALMKHH